MHNSVLFLQPKPIFAVESKIIKKVIDGTNTFIDISQSGSDITRERKDKDTGETFIEIIGKHFDYTSKVGPDSLETPDNKKMYEEWLWKASQSLLPQMILDVSDDPKKYYDQPFSGRSYLCVYNPDDSLKKEGPGNENGGSRSELRSEQLSWLNYMRRTLRQIRLVLSPVGGDTQVSQKYNDYTMDLANPPQCTSSDLGKLIKSAPAGLASTGFFSSLWDWLNALLLGGSKGQSSVKTLTPGREFITNFVEIPKSKLKGNDAGNASSYGTVEGKLPEVFAAFGPIVPGATEQKAFEIGKTKKNVDLNYDYANAVEEGRKSTLCTLVPESFQATLGIASHCSAMPTRSPTPEPRSDGMQEPDYVPLPNEEDLCTGENACDAIGSVTPTNFNCGFTANDVASLEGTSELKANILKASNLSGVPPKILAATLAIESRGKVSTYAKDTYVNSFGAEPTRCGAVGPMGISYSCVVDSSCSWAKDNWQTWCKYKGYANAVSGNTSTPNPRNTADALAVGAGIIRGWETATAAKENRAVRGCRDWTTQDAIQAYHLYFSGRYTSDPGNQCYTSTPYMDTQLYTILKDSIGNKADSYTKTKAGTLTVCEFVSGYYNNH